MKLISTTFDWNLGDDLIREGVLRLLRIRPTDPLLFVNRCQTIHGHLWTVKKNFPDLDEIFPHVKHFILAGTPEWLLSLEEIYKKCIEYGTPIKIVGVGMAQGDDQLPFIENANVEVCTVRDRFAEIYLEKAGLKPEWFFDPGVHANYPKEKKTIDTVLNYRPYGGNGEHTDKSDEAFVELAQKYKDRIQLITVHEPTEIALARRLFPRRKIFYSSDYVAYKKIYAKCRHYIGGRIHGAVPSFACGADVHLLYDRKKVNSCIRMRDYLRERLGFTNLKVYRTRDWEKISLSPPKNWKAVKEIIVEDFQAHREFLRG